MQSNSTPVFSSQLGITTLTPAGLLVGAKSIVCQNKQLRTEMKELERELETLQGQNDFMVGHFLLVQDKDS